MVFLIKVEVNFTHLVSHFQNENLTTDKISEKLKTFPDLCTRKFHNTKTII